MIQERSMIKVADNSGAKLIQVFRILGGSRKQYAGLGDIVIASVKVAEPRKQIKKKDIVKCVLIRQKNVYRRPDGSYFRFDENAVAIIDEKKQPRSTRIFGPIPREIRERGFEAIFQMAEEVV
jgi:large subunit ribosomal protein L14